MKLGVMTIELLFTEFRMTQEEATTEIENSLFGLGKELIGDESNMIASLAENLWEQRTIAPLALIANGIKREHVLKYETRKVPRGYHIRKRHKTSFVPHRHLSWCSRLLVAIKLGVMLIITLSDNQHDIGYTIIATIYLNLLACSFELHNLMRGQTIGIDAEA